jgi:hypothetical protein
MTDGAKIQVSAVMTADVQIPFVYTIIHGTDPSRRSPRQSARTRSINLMGLVFETQEMEKEAFHLSFTDSTYGRNSLEIALDLGKRFHKVELLGQVEWYERRSTATGHSFIVGVSFLDVPPDALTVLRDFLQLAAQGKLH